LNSAPVRLLFQPVFVPLQCACGGFPLAVRVFLIWLTVILWKRAAQSSSNGATG
jgi:hypothetical protein